MPDKYLIHKPVLNFKQLPMSKQKTTVIGLFLLALTINLHAQQVVSKEKFHTNEQMENDIGYTQAVKVGNTLYISGAVGWGTMPEAIKIVYDELRTTLKHYNADFSNVVKENLYSPVLYSLIAHKELRKPYYNNDYPAATWVEVKRLYNADLVLEVEVIAVLPKLKKHK
jgi:enamine deaminase RidA (YjgF/YER057c/UK114 family)